MPRAKADDREMAARFGTSGLRGLATELTDGTAARYVLAFAQLLRKRGQAAESGLVLVAADLRQSSPLLKAQIITALNAAGCHAVDCGTLPTPALAYAAMSRNVAAVMVTGSHIPADRNGLKFYLASGEISKPEEDTISRLAIGMRLADTAPPPKAQHRLDDLGAVFLSRLSHCLPDKPLTGMRVGLYEHSTVARDLLAHMLEQLGADVIRLGRSLTFVTLDTEAVAADVARTIGDWTEAHHLDAIVSADGDGDRPLIADESGRILRGDVIGLLTAQFLDAGAVVTPVTSNSGVETCFGKPVLRTRVGSPYVIAGIEAARRAGHKGIIGFEANGGVLLGDDMRLGSGVLSALPTRDSFLPIAAILCLAARARHSVSACVSTLLLPVTGAAKIDSLSPIELAQFLDGLGRDDRNLASLLQPLGVLSAIDTTDGIRATLSDGKVIFLRASGNEPALRCFVEARTEAEAQDLLSAVVALVAKRLG